MTERSDHVRRAYEDVEVARSYEAERSKNRFQRFRAGLERDMLDRALASTPPDARILDVACGTGRLSEHFATRARSYTGLDASAAMIEQAKRAHPTAGHWVRGDAFRLPFPTHTFDAVVSTRFLRHLDAKGRTAVFKELARVSRNLVIVELLLGEGLVWRWKRLSHSAAWNADATPRRPTHREALGELASAGLTFVARHALISFISQPHAYVCKVTR
jgi:ubiquinone/menaquinone biosynthesis C-methylase UbiE